MSIELISTWAGLAVLVGGFVWRMAVYSTEIKQNRKDINGIGAKVKDIAAEIKENKERFDADLDKAIEKVETKMNEVSAEINSISLCLARIEGKLNINVMEVK